MIKNVVEKNKNIDVNVDKIDKLKEDGYDVKFRVQINNTQISNLIRNL